jgi:hypothetical protein
LTDYFLIVTDPRKAPAVARAIAAFGYDAWIPHEVRFHRHRTKRSLSRMWEVPILIDAVLACVPREAHGELQRVKGFTAVWRDANRIAEAIPGDQVEAFRREVVEANARTRRAFRDLTENRPRSKRRWVPMTADDLMRYKAERFGTPDATA